MKRKLFIVLMVVVLLVLSTPLTARANRSLAIGGQLGFLASGVVVDIPLGPLAVQAGVNYPLGFTYIDAISDSDGFLGDLFAPFFVVTSDVTFPIGLGENFDLKIGISALGFTDFKEGVFGVLGPAIKGEYWIPNKNYGLFVNLNVPVMAYLITDDGAETFVHPILPLAGLFTTTAGVLWSL